ncbi:protein kinase [Candidatus Uabimicrobium sp. HlEnr_7]|uniref:protein kinase domain-containing protein n=1 Tax=Candidatus Uabimicrobium helgolandensis TaxID=3095367 RepID=UPI003559293B
MENKDILFARKALELRLIDKQHMKNCQVVQQQSVQQGKNVSLSQVATRLGFITQNHADAIEKLISQKQNIPNISKIQTNPKKSSTPDNSALFTSSMVGIHQRSTINTSDKFNHYIIEEKLGEGGMGAVYKVRDNKLRRSVALKVIIGSGALSEKQVQRFLNEARATASLKHPNIVEVYEIGTDPQNYFTMEFIEGRSLSSLIRSKNLSPHKAAVIMTKCSEALHYAHQKGIIHRDIKPVNIMMENNQEPKIMDFGLAKDIENEEQLSRTGNVLGTLVYMSPEQANGKDVDTRSDIYSLGASLYEVLSKRPPFQGENSMNLLFQIFSKDPVELRLLNPDIPRDLEAICLKCLHKKPEKRYQSAEELAKDLKNFIHNRPVHAQPITTWIRIKKNILRHRKHYIILASLIVILLAGICSYIYVTDQERQKALKAKEKALEAKEYAEKQKEEALEAKEYAEKQKEKALEAKEYAEEQRQKAVAARKEAEKARKDADEAKEDAEKSAEQEKEASYKANIILADFYNNENQTADASSVLKRAKENKPNAESFWEYRWQKNRGHLEVDHYLSKLNNGKQIKDIAISRNNYIVIVYDDSVALHNLNKKTPKTILWPGIEFNCGAISSNGLWVAVGDNKGNVYIANTKTLEKTRKTLAQKVAPNDEVSNPDEEQQIEDLSFNKDGTKLLVARQTISHLVVVKESFLQSLIVINVINKKIIKRFSIPKAYQVINSRARIPEIIRAGFTSCYLGKNIIGASEDGYIYTFHPGQVRFFGPHPVRIQQCAIHPSNPEIIISASEYNLYFWDQNVWNPNLRKKAASQKYIEKERLKSRISSFSFNTSGKKLAISTDNGQILVYSVSITKNKGKNIVKLKWQKTLTGHDTAKTCAFSSKDNIFSGGDGVKFWAKAYPKRIKGFLKHPSKIAVFHPKQNTLVLGQIASIVLIDSLSGKKKETLAGHFSAITHAQFSKQGNLYTSGFDGSIILWDLEKSQRKKTYYISKSHIRKFALVNGDKRIIVVGDKASIHSLDLLENGTVSTKKIYKINDLKNQDPYLAKFQIDTEENFNDISWNGKNLAAITGEGNWIYIIDTNTMKLKKIFHLENEQKNRRCLLYNDLETDRNYIFLTRDNKIVKREIDGNTLLEPSANFIGHTHKPLYISKDRKNTRMISCGKDGSIHFWPLSIKIAQLNTNKEINPYFSLKTKGVLTFCAFDRKGDKVATSGSDDKEILGNNSFFRIWNASTSLQKKPNGKNHSKGTANAK